MLRIFLLKCFSKFSRVCFKSFSKDFCSLSQDFFRESFEDLVSNSPAVSFRTTFIDTFRNPTKDSFRICSKEFFRESLGHSFKDSWENIRELIFTRYFRNFLKCISKYLFINPLKIHYLAYSGNRSMNYPQYAFTDCPGILSGIVLENHQRVLQKTTTQIFSISIFFFQRFIEDFSITPWENLSGIH